MTIKFSHKESNFAKAIGVTDERWDVIINATLLLFTSVKVATSRRVLLPVLAI